MKKLLKINLIGKCVECVYVFITFRYLFVDNHPNSNPMLRLRTNIMPGEDLVVFLPEGGLRN